MMGCGFTPLDTFTHRVAQARYFDSPRIAIGYPYGRTISLNMLRMGAMKSPVPF
jgi:hypothetical protein